MSRPKRPPADSSAARRARMVDVARLAGVSSMTVSRALREPDRVSPDTRRRIERAIGRVGYVPDLVASGLASQRTKVIAMIIPTLANSIFNDTVQGASDFLRTHGYQLLVGDSGYSEEEEEHLTMTLLGRRPDGLILTGTDHRPRARRLLSEAAIPVVETWELSNQPLDSVVGFSNRGAGQAMTRYLIERGYEHIGFLGTADRRAVRRCNGYEAALKEKGRPARVQLTEGPNWMQGAGLNFGKLMEKHPETDAVFCTSDILAAGALFECQRRGWAVPGRVALAGLGDFDIATEVVPPLTTLRIPRYEMGRRAAEVLLDRIEERVDSGITVDVGFEVIARASA